MRVEVSFATSEDAAAIEPWLRASDRDELVAASGPDVAGQLVEAVAMSAGRLGPMAFAARRGGELIALFGFVPRGALSDVAYPWLVGTDGLTKAAGTLNRLTRSYCSAVLGAYPVLLNYVDARNTVSIAWLSRTGFEVQDAEPFGVAGLPFHRFEMRDPNV